MFGLSKTYFPNFVRDEYSCVLIKVIITIPKPMTFSGAGKSWLPLPQTIFCKKYFLYTYVPC